MDVFAAIRERWSDSDRQGWPPSKGLARMGLIFLLALPAGPAVSDNQLVNSSFDENLDGWTLFAAPGEAVWNSLDVAGSPDSGSALLSQENTATKLRSCSRRSLG